ncbi:GNAT family N-acetyltransferase [Phyllobacterium myrsinacearum]|uniref:Putative N-acetyltransferase YhbS n=1 Tax=Phyllobacterium myrsinacearum TaxID=28101 RepID=A0A839EHR1_9HYPH|nr:GNAT family N-acetyltransferase [Phyllobacterium myrsinacearum]MBA8877084.1 putative N-acetyltransferase YhbS [Phyllobacterium myrsinacearum]
MEMRPLTRDQIEQIWTIDRSEIIENIYTLRDGELVLHPEFCDAQGWEEGEADKYTPLLQQSFDRGGKFFGAFDGEKLAGAGIVDSIWRGPAHNLLQLSFLHVSHGYRGQRLGVKLFERSKEAAKALGAKGLYVSATPSEHTVNFYRYLGCVVMATPDPELFAMEPEDIHMECIFN